MGVRPKHFGVNRSGHFSMVGLSMSKTRSKDEGPMNDPTTLAQSPVSPRPPLPRRAFLGAALSAAVVGSVSILGIIGVKAAPRAQDFRFSRGTTFDAGQQEALRHYLATVAPDARIHLLLSGHTGTQGDAEANLELSVERAEATRSIALDLGISNDRIQIAGHGGLMPLERQPEQSEREFQRSLARVTVSAQALR